MSVTVRMITPQLHGVTWRGDGDATAAEADELLQLASSRRAGAHVLLAASDGSPRPRALDVLSEGTPALAATIAIGAEARALQFHAPRGRGRVVELGALDAGRLDAMLQELRSREGMKAFERALDDALAAEAARWREQWHGPQAGHEGKRATTHAEAGHLEPDMLLPADRANARAYSHEADGAVAIARTGFTDDLRVGLLIRGRESFELRPRGDGRPFTGFSLVLSRLTAPEDRGAVLRVELDDEDLGPWRLGQRGSQRDALQCSLEEFTIASDLLAGRERFRLAFTPASEAPIATFQWTFGAAREIDGSWLQDLEPSAVALRGVAMPAEEIELAVCITPETGQHQRGIEMPAGMRIEYSLPEGYSRFTATLIDWERAAPEPDAALTIELDGKPARTEKVAPRGWRHVDLPLAGARRLSLSFLATKKAERLQLLEPALLRRPG